MPAIQVANKEQCRESNRILGGEHRTMASGRSSGTTTNDANGRGRSRSLLFLHRAINLRRTAHSQDPVTLL